MAVCIFCGIHAPLTREHVLPQWVGSLPPGEGPFTIKRISASGNAVEHHAKGVDIVARVVCGTCNSGWMADLEAQAQLLLTPMINGQRQQLMPNQQHVVSRWAVKTAIMFLYATQPPVGIDAEHRARLSEGKIPANTGVWLARYRADPPAYNSWIRARVIEMRLRHDRQNIREGRAITLTLGHYCQQVLLTPSAWFSQGFEFTAPATLRRFVIPVPRQRAVVWPPPAPVGTEDLEQYADAFGAVEIETPSQPGSG